MIFGCFSHVFFSIFLLKKNLAGSVIMQTEPKRGLGRSPNGGLGGQSPPTKKPSDNYVPVQLLRSLHVYAISEVNAYTPVLVYK